MAIKGILQFILNQLDALLTETLVMSKKDGIINVQYVIFSDLRDQCRSPNERRLFDNQ